MKKSDIEKIRAKKIKQLKKDVLKKKIELMKADMKRRSGQEKNLKKVKKKKREIAQILTIIREKEIMEEQK
jgi:ribosomal protein L29